MQLMPRTARAMGVPPGKEQNPEESIKAAVKYIAATSRSFNAIKNENERMKFVLAAYNAGIGHVLDAMALAEKYGKNKYVWDNSVDDYILLKSNEEYFNDPVCKNGYFRGVETYNFVKEVMSRGEVYKKKIKDWQPLLLLFQVDFKNHSAGKVTAAVELYHRIDIIFPKAVFSTYINCTGVIFSHKVQFQPVP